MSSELLNEVRIAKTSDYFQLQHFNIFLISPLYLMLSKDDSDAEDRQVTQHENFNQRKLIF